MSAKLTHLDEQGRARMVDVGAKDVTERICTARAALKMAPATLEAIASGATPKGDVLASARLAGIMAAKRTGEWIPLAHPMPLDAIEVRIEPDLAAGCVWLEATVRAHWRTGVEMEATVRAHWRTGVEMEALVAVSAAGLTIYDMCKAMDRGMVLSDVRLVRKSGGKSGVWIRPGEAHVGE